jgi:hypothetical protein
MPYSPQEVAYKQRLNNFVDGFAVNTALIPNRYGYQSLCLDGLGPLRLANNYRPKIYAVPDQSELGTGLIPFTDYMTQVRALPGTLVVGMSLVVLNWNNQTDVAFNLEDNFYISVEDDATGVPFFSDWLCESMFNMPVLYTDATNTGVTTYVAKTAWLPLTKPRPIEDSGIMTIKMCYKATPASSGNISPQLLIICAEPCTILTQTLECE